MLSQDRRTNLEPSANLTLPDRATLRVVSCRGWTEVDSRVEQFICEKRQTKSEQQKKHSNGSSKNTGLTPAK